MNPRRNTSALAAKRFLQVSLFCLAAVLLVRLVLVPGSAQATGEREFEDTTPKHLPIKVKIKKEKEKAFKDLKNEKWTRDLVLEITNTGDKPIYLLHFIVILPEIRDEGGRNISFGLSYGRAELGDIETKAGPDDVPIKPGETHTFDLGEGQTLGWEGFQRERKWPQPKKLVLAFQILSFGDGTGFWGNEGLAVPRAPDESSSMNRQERKSDKTASKPSERQHAPPDCRFQRLSMTDLPARILPVNFFIPGVH